MRNIFTTIFLFLLTVTVAHSQSLIYSQPFAGTSFPTGFSASGAQAANLSNNTSSASSGYTSPTASGGGNMADGNTSPTAGTAILTASGVVSTVGLTNIKVMYGARKTSAYTGTITFQWSSNGTLWNTITYSDVSASGSWAKINGGTQIALPVGAEGVSNLQFKWTFVRTNASGNYRIDDFSVYGTATCTTPNDVSAPTIVSNPTQLDLSWTNGTCYDEILVVGTTVAAVTATPSGNGSAYTANAAFSTGGSNVSLPTSEYAVYKGTGTTVSITGLTNNTLYAFKIFARLDSTWSTGVTISGTPKITTLYSRGSGIAATGAIWALTPTGTPATVASLGGFSASRNVVIQSNDVVQISSSPLNVRCLYVESNAKIWRNSSSTGSMVYVTVYGDTISIDGEVGNGSTFDAIGFQTEGSNLLFTGSGLINIGRLRKGTSTNSVSNVNLNANINFLFPGVAVYNNVDNTTFNLTFGSGQTFNFNNTSDIAIDGVLGLSTTDNRGNFVVNGTLINVDTLLLRSLNNTGNTSFTVNNGGHIGALVVIDSTGANPTDFNFILNSGATMEINDRVILIAGDINVPSGATLLFKSTAINHCATIDNFSKPTYNGTITGTISAERYTPLAGSNQHFIGSPLSNVAFSDINTPTGANDVFVTPTANCDEDNLLYTSNYGNFFEWDEANVGGGCVLNGWKVKSSGTLENAKGYSAYLVGDTTFKVNGTANLGSSYATSVTMGTWSLTTPTLQGNTYESGWNLIGNPYLSSLDVPVKAGFNNDIKLFNTSGPYTGTYSTVFAGSNAVIAPFQGFYVRKSTSGTGSYSIAKTECKYTPGSVFFKTNNTMEIDIAGNGFADRTFVGFDAGAAAGFDNGLDAAKFLSKSKQPTLYTELNGQRMEYNILDAITQSLTVNLNLVPGKDGNFTLTFKDLANLPLNAKVTLEDKKVGTFKSITENSTYTFQSTVSDNPSRFVLHFTNESSTTAINTVNNESIIIAQLADKLIIDATTSAATVTSVDVVNVLGQTMISKKINSALENIDLSNLPNGNYIAIVNTDNNRYIKKRISLTK